MSATPSLLRTLRSLAFGALVLVGATTAFAGSGEGYLGVYLQDLDEALATALDLDGDEGVLITKVVDDSPAAEAGLQTGDVVLTVNGEVADGSGPFTKAIRKSEPGDEVELALLRRGKKKKIKVTLGEAENTFSIKQFGDQEDGRHMIFMGEDDEGPHKIFMGKDGNIELLGDDGEEFEIKIFRGGDGDDLQFFSSAARPSLGVKIHEFDEKLGRYFGAEKGVLVLGVIEDSAAEEAGLEAGDVITSVAGDEVTESADIFAALEDHEEGDKITVEFLRNKKSDSREVELDAGNNFEFANRMGDHFRWRGGPPPPHAPKYPRGKHLEKVHEHLQQLHKGKQHERMMIREHGDDLREELQEIREELQELREKLDEEEGR